MPNDLPPWWVVYQQTRRWIGAGCFEQDRAHVEKLAVAVQRVTGDHVELAYVD
jgi:hypothetical protein